MLRSLIFVAALLALGLAPPAQARTLHGAGGFSVKASKGYKLSTKRGVYRISGRGGSLRFARVAAAGRSPAAAGAELARALKAKPKHVHKSASRYRATVGKRSIDLRKAPKKRLTVRTLAGKHQAALRRIGNTIRGGKQAALPRSIAMKRFTAADGGSTALVPDIKGWRFNGGSGVIEGSGPQGSFAFGVPFGAALPGTLASGSFPSVPFPANAADGLARVVPAYFQRFGADVAALTNIRPFPGANLVSAPPFTSTFASARVIQTRSPGGEGVFFYGYAPPDETGTYFNYLSYAAVQKGTSPRIGAALLRAWSSWNPSANQAQRTADTIHTILTTQVAGGGIDPDVFDEAAAKWDAYIRGPAKDDN